MWRLFNSMRDMYSNVTLILAAIIVIFLSQVNPKAKSTETIKPPGDIAVLMCWAPGPTDVDLWLSAPGDKSVGYSRKSGTVWALLRDDMGIVNDVSPINCESGFARATPAGEYVINLHGYSLQETTSVHIEISLSGRLLVSTNLDLRPKQERTVVRFTLDGQGSIVSGSQSQVFKPLRSAS